MKKLFLGALLVSAVTFTQCSRSTENSVDETQEEIVDGVYQQGSQHLFSSEIETLNAVIVVLKKLDKFFKMMGLDILHYSLKQELKQVAMEDAA